MNVSSFFFPPTDSTGNALSTRCYFLSCIFINRPCRSWTQPGMRIWLRRRGWAWTPCAYVLSWWFTCPRATATLTLPREVLLGCLSSYTHIVYIDHPRWMALIHAALLTLAVMFLQTEILPPPTRKPQGRVRTSRFVHLFCFRSSPELSLHLQ